MRQGLDIYPTARERPALPVHVSPLRRGDARLGEHAGPHRVAAGTRAGEFGGVAGLHRAVRLAGGQARGTATSAGRDRSVALDHRAGLQHLPAGSAQSACCWHFCWGRLPAFGEGGRFGAGALVATAAAIKAFPILVLGYLIYRRMWTASAATVAVLAAWLLIAPLPFRTPAQAVDDLVVWSQGMLFTYNTHGIAQRPFRSYSYKNQSIMALSHRLLRDVPADGESVLSRRARAARPAPTGRRDCHPSTLRPTCSHS